jgi:hypothetical protein
LQSPAALAASVSGAIQTRLSAFSNGSGRSNSGLTRLKTAVFAPILRARIVIAIRVKPGSCLNPRSA